MSHDELIGVSCWRCGKRITRLNNHPQNTCYDCSVKHRDEGIKKMKERARVDKYG